MLVPSRSRDSTVVLKRPGFSGPERRKDRGFVLDASGGRLVDSRHHRDGRLRRGSGGAPGPRRGRHPDRLGNTGDTLSVWLWSGVPAPVKSHRSRCLRVWAPPLTGLATPGSAGGGLTHGNGGRRWGALCLRQKRAFDHGVALRAASKLLWQAFSRQVQVSVRFAVFAVSGANLVDLVGDVSRAV